MLNLALKTLRKTFILLIGGTVILLGLLLFLTPCPGLPVLLAGLAILGVEFAFARRMLRQTRAIVTEQGRRLKRVVDVPRRKVRQARQRRNRA